MQKAYNYKTKQKEAVLAYLKACHGHITVSQIAEDFQKSPVSIGLTTIYRHLDRLVKEGKVRKYLIEGISGACYQYISTGDNACRHFHLKCEKCGNLTHLECGFIDQLEQHIFTEHDFSLNADKTVFLGKCQNCMNKHKPGGI